MYFIEINCIFGILGFFYESWDFLGSNLGNFQNLEWSHWFSPYPTLTQNISAATSADCMLDCMLVMNLYLLLTECLLVLLMGARKGIVVVL